MGKSSHNADAEVNQGVTSIRRAARERVSVFFAMLSNFRARIRGIY
jgi:hypothetical protein